ncbi:12188_t:CDS:2 [Entrophospora sp. SA101]|nr:12188_t:CDS:2 [Entrophospora sp. SA101]
MDRPIVAKAKRPELVKLDILKSKENAIWLMKNLIVSKEKIKLEIVEINSEKIFFKTTYPWAFCLNANQENKIHYYSLPNNFYNQQKLKKLFPNYDFPTAGENNNTFSLTTSNLQLRDYQKKDIEFLSQLKRLKNLLIITPSILQHHWQKSIEDWLSEPSYVITYLAKQESSYFQKLKKRKASNNSYGVIIDEAHFLRNYQSQQKFHQGKKRFPIRQVKDFKNLELQQELQKKLSQLSVNRKQAEVLPCETFLIPLAHLLKEKKIELGIITGQTAYQEKQKFIQQFQKQELNILLCNIQAAGMGLNLSQADTIIFADRSYSPADNEQAEARFLPTNSQENQQVRLVIDLICKGSIDEKIKKLLKRKEDIIRVLNDNPEYFFS